MINLLPPDIKKEVRYSKYNARLVRYLFMTTVAVIILAGALLGGRLYLNRQILDTSANIDSTNDSVARYAKLEKQAKVLNDRLTSIQAIQKSQAKFSVLLSDLAEFMPQGTSISSISLTGDDKKPIRLTVSAVDYKTALSFRDSIARSKRISAADIESVALAPSGSGSSKADYQVVVTFSFHPGAAK